MSRRLRLGGLAISGVVALALAAGCSSNSSSSPSAASSSGTHGTLIVFGAGTLATPFAAEIAAFKAQNPGVTVNSQFGRQRRPWSRTSPQLGQPADVLGVADYSLIPKPDPIPPSRTRAGTSASWPTRSPSPTPATARAPRSSPRATGTRCWPQPGVRIGRSNAGRRPVGLPDPADAQAGPVLLPRPRPLGVGAEELAELAAKPRPRPRCSAALQSGQIDYLAIYRSDALQNHFKYIKLPAQISLSDPGWPSSLRHGERPGRELGMRPASPSSTASPCRATRPTRRWARSS